MRKFILLAAFAATGALAAAAAGAGGVTIHVHPSSVHRGHVAHLFGVVPGCQGGVTLLSRAFSHKQDFAGLPAITAPVDTQGKYSVYTRIPANRKPQKYSISGRCGGGNIGVFASITVLA
ncbi:MAG: hypothetical protein ACR2KV_00210 [Solirubrobacteraceae bacterium]